MATKEEKARTQGVKDAALKKLDDELAGDLEQQLENDALIWARTIEFSKKPVQELLQRIFLLFYHYAVSYRSDSDTDTWNPWTWPTSALLSHGCRVLIQYPANSGLEAWLGFRDVMTSRYSTHYITPITHGAGGVKRKHDWKHDENVVKVMAQFGGRKFIREVSLKAKDGTDYFSALGPLRQAFNKGANYGLNLAIGGDSDEVEAKSGKLWVWYDPAHKPIKPDGGHGHLFFFHRENIVNVGGVSYSGLLIGCENSAPMFFGEKGTKTNKGALTGGHGPAGHRNPVSATGGCKWSEMKDAALVKPDNFDCVFMVIDGPVSSVLDGKAYTHDLLSKSPLSTNIRPAPKLKDFRAADKTLFYGGVSKAMNL
jgi:hypothetical protein